MSELYKFDNVGKNYDKPPCQKHNLRNDLVPTHAKRASASNKKQQAPAPQWRERQIPEQV